MAISTTYRVFRWDPESPAAIWEGWVEIDRGNASVTIEPNDASRTIGISVTSLADGLHFAGVTVKHNDSSYVNADLHAVGDYWEYGPFTSSYWPVIYSCEVCVFTNGTPPEPPAHIRININTRVDPAGAAADGEECTVDGKTFLTFTMNVGEVRTVRIRSTENCWHFRNLTRDLPTPVQTRGSRDITYDIGPYREDGVHNFVFTAHYDALGMVDVKFSPNPADHGPHGQVRIDPYTGRTMPGVVLTDNRQVGVGYDSDGEVSLSIYAEPFPGYKIVALVVDGVVYRKDPYVDYIECRLGWIGRSRFPIHVKAFFGCGKLLYQQGDNRLLCQSDPPGRLFYCG